MGTYANSSAAVFPPATGAKTGVFNLSKADVPARIVATGLAGAEAVQLFTIDGDADTQTAVFKDGVAVTLTATNPGIVIGAPGPYAVSKPATAGVAGVYVNEG